MIVTFLKLGIDCFIRMVNFLFVIFTAYYRCGIGAVHIGTELCKNLIKGNTDGNRQTKLKLDALPDLLCNLLPVSVDANGTGNIQPTLIHAKGFYEIRVSVVNLMRQLGNFRFLHFLVIVVQEKNLQEPDETNQHDCKDAEGNP